MDPARIRQFFTSHICQRKSRCSQGPTRLAATSTAAVMCSRSLLVPKQLPLLHRTAVSAGIYNIDVTNQWHYAGCRNSSHIDDHQQLRPAVPTTAISQSWRPEGAARHNVRCEYRLCMPAYQYCTYKLLAVGLCLTQAIASVVPIKLWCAACCGPTSMHPASCQLHRGVRLDIDNHKFTDSGHCPLS